MTPPGLQNQAQKAPKIEAKSLPGGFNRTSKGVSEKGAVFGAHFKGLGVDFGGQSKMAGQNAPNTSLASELGLSTPGSVPGAHLESLGP